MLVQRKNSIYSNSTKLLYKLGPLYVKIKSNVKLHYSEIKIL